MYQLYKMALCLGALLSASVFAGVITDSSITDVHHRGSSEVLGTGSWTVDGDDFANASPETPIFLEISLSHLASLASTRVALASSDVTINQPIHLAMSLVTSNGALQLAAPRATVSIVRWVEGETSFWVRIAHSSSSWIQAGDMTRAPGDGAAVMFRIGTRGNHGPTVPASQRNLPFNLRATASEQATVGEDTLICANLAASNLASDSSHEALLVFDAFFYDHDADLGNGAYAEGTPSEASVNGSFFLARGKQFAVNYGSGSNQEIVAQWDNVGEGNASVTNQLQFALSNSGGNDDLLPAFTNGSEIVLNVDTNLGLGFAAGSVSLSGDRLYSVDYQNPFTLNSETLYGRARIIYEGSDQLLSNLGFSVQASVSFPRDTALVSIHPDYEVFLNREGLCGSSLASVVDKTWPLAQLKSKRFIPHLVRGQGRFSASLVIANPAAEPADYEVEIYTSAGILHETMSGNIAGNATAVEVLSNLPGDGGYARISQDSNVAVSVAYQVLGEGMVPAQLHETTRTSTRWRVYAGAPSVTYDGVAYINTGDTPANITISQINKNGETLSSQVIHDFSPGAKGLFVLSSAFPYDADAFYEVSSSAPLALVALRGDQQSQYLWENPALSLAR